jgi:ubiquinone biosynthesis protein UbiJ
MESLENLATSEPRGSSGFFSKIESFLESSGKLSRLFAKALESLIKADPDYLILISGLQGGSLKLDLTEWAISVIFLPENQALKILPMPNPDLEKFPASVSISGRLPDFLGLMRAESSSLIKSHVSIQGDVRVLARYQSFFQRWNIDLGHVLASCLGEGPARALFPPLKKASEFLKYQHAERMQDLKEVLYEEKKLLVPQAELENFYDDLKQLQMRVDRLFESYKLQSLKS